MRIAFERIPQANKRREIDIYRGRTSAPAVLFVLGKKQNSILVPVHRVYNMFRGLFAASLQGGFEPVSFCFLICWLAAIHSAAQQHV